MNILFFLRPKSDLAYVYDNHTLRQVLETMEYHKYSSVPVLNREGKYVGSITEGDLLWWIKDHANLDLKKAENILMTEVTRRYDYQAVNAGAKMEDLIDRAMEQNFVPVVDDQQNFIGIITRREIISYCYKHMERGIKSIKKVSKPIDTMKNR